MFLGNTEWFKRLRSLFSQNMNVFLFVFVVIFSGITYSGKVRSQWHPLETLVKYLMISVKSDRLNDLEINCFENSIDFINN